MCEIDHWISNSNLKRARKSSVHCILFKKLDKILQYFQHSYSDYLKGTIHKLRRGGRGWGSAITLRQGKRGMPCKGGGVGKIR